MLAVDLESEHISAFCVKIVSTCTLNEFEPATSRTIQQDMLYTEWQCRRYANEQGKTMQDYMLLCIKSCAYYDCSILSYSMLPYFFNTYSFSTCSTESNTLTNMILSSAFMYVDNEEKIN